MLPFPPASASLGTLSELYQSIVRKYVLSLFLFVSVNTGEVEAFSHLLTNYISTSCIFMFLLVFLFNHVSYF